MIQKKEKDNEAYPLAKWRVLATQGLFPPDRKIALREFFDHQEEGREHYIKLGLTRGEADRRVLEDLGDPAETAALLRAVHNPWIGWGLLLARCLSFLLAVGLVLMIWTGKLTREQLRLEKWDGIGTPRLAEGEYGVSVYRDAEWTDRSIKVGSFRVNCEDVAVGHKSAYGTLDAPVFESENQDYSHVVLRYIGAPWNRKPALHVVDQTGRELHWEGNYYNTLPWETIVVMRVTVEEVNEYGNPVFYWNLAYADDVESIDIYTDSPSDAIHIQLQDCEVASNLLTMAEMDDCIDAYMSAMKEENKDGTRITERVVSRNTKPTDHAKLGDTDLWIAQTRQKTVVQFFQNAGPSVHYQEPYAECVLKYQRDDISEETLKTVCGTPCEIDVTALLASEKSSGVQQQVTNRVICSDGEIYCVEWRPLDDVVTYAVECTDPEGESCVLTVRLDEERSLTE